ncbi:hypothetical protein V501_09200 [Pseudogymnoascus sp. VKM F-4519 (FW-2642)]|nr:hypothetical protein V501_09200 [Pseudogymnoascus sp. VKM F-4519 (FW-2642)]
MPPSCIISSSSSSVVLEPPRWQAGGGMPVRGPEVGRLALPAPRVGVAAAAAGGRAVHGAGAVEDGA